MPFSLECKGLHWHQQMPWYALVLMADYVQRDRGGVCSLEALDMHIQGLNWFQRGSHDWVQMAIEEQLFFVHLDESVSRPFIRVNSNHQIAQNAYLRRVRILMMLRGLLMDREWVECSVLEEALATDQFFQDREYSAAWLDLLLELGVLLGRFVPQFGHPVLVIALSSYPSHYVLPLMLEQERQNQAYLMDVLSDYCVNRNNQVMQFSQLLLLLTEKMTSIEAQYIVKRAIEQRLVHLSSSQEVSLPPLSFTVSERNTSRCKAVGSILCCFDG
ncbi:hypothetical protein KTT_26610 [Tengunoibacter tsumagoiensis]|uniref:Uncharacterized protein n=2 Tax=Tengunoibacter tsumagoiensis TaxID=2014871 RepID=A0A402A172_9CHLR|nr:hypothetical protein KTT_26610 [Tengunoibacter tsumagoiensis]